MEELKNISSFGELIKSEYSLKIPSYHRAYAWEKEQIQQFVDDLIDINGKGYYYGHFILLLNKDEKVLEIIDGQQRITTFVLFLLSAKLYFDYELQEHEEYFIRNRFETIEYDKDRFKELVDNILDHNKLINELENDNSSFKRILEALKSFKEALDKKKNVSILELINSLNKAIISLHFTEDKKVAVQIFELQNLKGIQMNLIEKFKARLMKEIYLNSDENVVTENINEIQKHLSKIS